MKVPHTIAADTMHTSGQAVLVHKDGQEGAITIDPVTGYVLTPLDERPDWASELTIAQTTERHMFYMDRLGELYTAERQAPYLLAAEDLQWFGVREYPADAPYKNEETGEEELSELYVVEPDHEFRQNILSTALGITAELDAQGNETGSIAGLSASEVAISEDVERSAEEIAELERVQASSFSKVANS